MLKYLNESMTLVQFGQSTFVLEKPGDFTSIGDSETRAKVAAHLFDGGAVLPYEPPKVDLEADVVLTVQELLDEFARARGYDSIVSLCSYATSTHPRFKADGDRGVAARDGYWGGCLQIKEDVKAGKRAMPTTRDEVLAELPPLKWPEE